MSVYDMVSRGMATQALRAASLAPEALATAEQALATAEGITQVVARKFLSANYVAGSIVMTDSADRIFWESPDTEIAALDVEVAAKTAVKARTFLSNLYTGTVHTDGEDRIIGVASSSSGGGVSGPGRSYSYEATYRTNLLSSSDAASAKPCLQVYIFFGQSLDIGGVGELATPVAYKTTANPATVKMLSAGVRPDTGNSASFTAAAEAVAGQAGDTGMVAFLDRLSTLFYSVHSVHPLLLGIVQGAGGTAIENLSRGSTRYNLLLKNIGEARAICTGLGWDMIVRAVHTKQGNANTGITSRAAFERMWKQWAHDINDDVRGITGQVDQVMIGMAQPDSSVWGANEPGVPMAMLDLCQRDPRFYAISAHYDLTRDDANSVHPSNLAYTWLGERDAFKAFIQLNGRGMPVFAPSQARFVSATVIEYIVPLPWVGETLLDNPDGLITTSGLGSGKGHVFDDGSGSPPAITGVVITNGLAEGPAAKVQITLATAPSGPYALLAYAVRRDLIGSQDGPVAGARGTLFASTDQIASLGTDGLAENGTHTRTLYEPMARWALQVSR